MKRAMVVMACLIVGLQYKLWCEPDGVLSLMKLNQAMQQQQLVNHKLSQSNLALAAQVDDLKRGTAAIEEHARTELGLIKEGEVFYQFIQVT